MEALTGIPGKQRVFGLDIVRASAILFVLIGHSRNYLPPSFLRFYDFLILDGVSIFFVLSEFLIGGILIKTLETDRPHFKTLLFFWIRRWLRTLPNYYFVLFLLVVIAFFSAGGFDFSRIIPYLFFLQNFSTDHAGFFTESWSLSIEEWFYLLVPVLLFILVGLQRMNTRRAILFTAIFILLVSTGIRCYRYFAVPIVPVNDWDFHFRRPVVTRLDSIMFGIIGAYLSYYCKARWARFKIPFLVAGIFILILNHVLAVTGASGTGFYHFILSFSVDALAVLILLPAMEAIKTGKGWLFKILTFLSIISYSLYLLNYSFVHLWLMRILPINNIPGKTGYVVGYTLFWIYSIVAAFMLYRFFEKPIMDLRDKIKKGRPGSGGH